MSNFKKEIMIGIGAITLGLSLPAFAQIPPDRAQLRQQMMDRMDTDHDGKISEAERKAAIDKHFASTDTNHDGFITEDEMKAAHEKRQAQERKTREHNMFTRLDTNGDGKISKSEFEAGAQKRHEHMQQRKQHDGAGPMGDAPPPDQE